jgi:pyruvate/2-oxoglutarate dehydrogenase complex dihydrolipoamide acyltransferase (E2) component
MSKLLDHRKLTQYLLGSLPTAEAERLDELSVADDEAAEGLRSVENDLIDAYVQDELDAEERALFKSHYRAFARRRERVSFAQDFQGHVEEILARQTTKTRVETPAEARAETATEVATGRKRSRWFSIRRGLNLSPPAWQLGAVMAALALLTIGGWLVFDNARLRQRSAQTEASAERERHAPEARKESENQRVTASQLADERARAERERLAQEQSMHDRHRIAEQQRTAEQQHAAEQQRTAERQGTAARNPSSSGAGVRSSIASFILAPQVRGGGQMQSISIPANAGHVVMRLRLEPNEFTAYRVTLLDETGAQTLRRSNRLKARVAGDDKVLNFNLRARFLKPQTSYVLRVTNDAGEIVDDYPFRVVK